MADEQPQPDSMADIQQQITENALRIMARKAAKPIRDPRIFDPENKGNRFVGKTEWTLEDLYEFSTVYRTPIHRLLPRNRS